MTEGEAVKLALMPRTRESIARDLRSLGLYEGMTVLVHSSLSSLGWVCGGPVAVVQALMDVVTPDGTIVMPTHSADYTEPSDWANPPVPEEWWPIIRETMPAYDPRVTPTRKMGKIVECFRTWPGVFRSSHPAFSFAAGGKNAREVTEGHSLDYPMGERSPLARVYDLDGWVLLLGVGYGRNTSFHLAENRVPGAKERQGKVPQGAPVMEDGRRVWKTYRDIEYDGDCFEELGADFERDKEVRIGTVGSATARLFRQREVVDYAVEWLGRKR